MQADRLAREVPILLQNYFWTPRAQIAIVRQSLAAANDVRVAPKAQAIFCRRRHQPRRPPPANIRPGSPAPTIGPGTAAVSEPEVRELHWFPPKHAVNGQDISYLARRKPVERLFRSPELPLHETDATGRS
jgi:hypothetical protein